jgi:peptidoglycan hydrolase-like protein with peptidoglycan-binding domain
VTEDGQFGPKSVAALKNVQGVLGVPADGVCGPKTWQAFENGIKVQADSGNWG